MIYLDNAATTFPKPLSVNNAVAIAMKKYGANPGRSGHEMSIKASEEIYNCRKVAADLFNAQGPECVIFTQNCTHSTNIVLKGYLKPGDHVLISCLEHNAVMRPLRKLSDNDITFTMANVYPGDNNATLDSFRNGINEKTKLIVCIHASNVWGIKLPIERIAALGHEYGIPILVDAAQTAGVVPIDVTNSKIDYLCVAGHKGLYGPMGTGMLITNKGDTLDSLIEGGTGTSSISYEQPSTVPDKFESGTPNIIGISGLKAGMEFIKSKGIDNILAHEHKLILKLYDSLYNINDIELYTKRPDIKSSVPVLSFNVKEKDSETVAEFLNRNGIAVRAGLHCAPTAHQFYDTLNRGAVRVCPSAFSKMNEVDYLISVLKKMIKK